MGWSPETFWASTLHEFYRYVLAYLETEEAEETRARARMSWLMWAAGVTWAEGMSPDRLFDMMTPKAEPDPESPVQKFKAKYMAEHGLN